MLRNFIRDRVTQFTLGTFVASFFYAVLKSVSIAPGPHGAFVPHLSITVTLALVVVDLGMLILFIDHISKSIQLPQVIASIAGDLGSAIDAEMTAGRPTGLKAGPSLSEMTVRMDDRGGVVRARSSGYLQFVRRDTLMGVASRTNSVVRLHLRPGHFVAAGQRLATVWPPEAAAKVARALDRAHATGPHDQARSGEDPPSRRRHARRDDPSARGARESHGPHQDRATAGSRCPPGHDDPPGERDLSLRGTGPRGYPTRLRHDRYAPKSANRPA
jgi:Predicted membrane protein (DUF2254)